MVTFRGAASDEERSQEGESDERVLQPQIRTMRICSGAARNVITSQRHGLLDRNLLHDVAAADLVDDVHAFGNFTEDGVLLVQKPCFAQRDVKLRSG